MITVYIQKKKPAVFRKPKTKSFRIVKKVATLPSKQDDHSAGLRLSQRLDQIILAFRKKNDSGKSYQPISIYS